MALGSLTIAGTGICIGQMTVEAHTCIERAGSLLALVADPITLNWLVEKNPDTQSLLGYYGESKPRRESYQEMVEYAMSLLRNGKDVCLVVYGHPGVFSFPAHELMRRTALEKILAHVARGFG